MITRYVYANSYITSFDFDDDVINKIKELGGLDELSIFNNRFESVPDELTKLGEDAYGGFINGIVYSQYANSLSAGNFLNPLLIGLSTDYAMWIKIMKRDNIIRDIVYVDVPYETYCELVPKELHTSKEEYETHSAAIEKLSNALTEGLRTTLH